MKKGFTLIELLAVILILGIIALIAIPTVTSVIEDSKKGALKSSAQNIAKVAEQQCNLEKIGGKEITKLYTIENGKASSNLDVKNLPDNGMITVDDECQAKVAISDNGYCSIKKGENVSVNENIYNCTLDYVEIPNTESSCFIFDETTHTITGYNFDDETCPMDISIPATINDIPVEYIGELAFREDNYDYVVYVAEDTDSNTWYDPVKENLILRNYTFVGAMFVSRTGTKPENELQKTCLQSVNDRIGTPMPLMYSFIDSTYIGCGFTNETFVGLQYADSGNITSVDFSKAINLKSIGFAAFIDNKISNIYFGNNPYLENLGVATFKNNNINTSINLSGLTNLKTTGTATFQGESVTGLILPQGLEEIGMNSFYRSSIEVLNLPSSVKLIGDWSLTLNPLNSINLTNNLENIGEYAFAGTSISGTLTIPNSLIKVSQGTFNQCTNLTSVILGDNIEEIEAFAFAKASINSITFNNKLRIIGNKSFWDCNLTSLVFPSSLKTIEYAAFWDNKINSVTFNAGLESIGEHAFNTNCLTLPVSTPTGTTVGSNAFAYNPVSAEICE